MEIKRFSKKDSVRQSFKSDPKYDGYERGLPSMVFQFFDKKSSGSGVAVIEPNYHLSNELHRQIIRKFKDEKFIHPLETIFGCWFDWYAIIEQRQQRNQVFIVYNRFV